jgi:hypothetical protein
MWIDFVTTFLGDECVKYVMAHPSEPDMDLQVGDVPLGDTPNEEERFFYSLIPGAENGQKVLAWSVPAVSMLWMVWWQLIAHNHRVVGSLGIRKGWVLVQPAYRDPIDELGKALLTEMQSVMVGKFEFKPEGGEKILPS